VKYSPALPRPSQRAISLRYITQTHGTQDSLPLRGQTSPNRRLRGAKCKSDAAHMGNASVPLQDGALAARGSAVLTAPLVPESARQGRIELVDLHTVRTSRRCSVHWQAHDCTRGEPYSGHWCRDRCRLRFIIHHHDYIVKSFGIRCCEEVLQENGDVNGCQWCSLP
jgi:hypothetical protein